jgi:hypothetical protein
VTEVRDSLGDPPADVWAQTSERLAAQLKRVWLTGGLELVAELSDELRRLLKAMQATAFLPPPAGTFPTPSFALPISEGQLRDMETMRQAIAEVAGRKGRHTLPDILVGTVDIRRQHGRKALRLLEALGEYDGFARPLHRAGSSRISQTDPQSREIRPDQQVLADDATDAAARFQLTLSPFGVNLVHVRPLVFAQPQRAGQEGRGGAI